MPSFPRSIPLATWLILASSVSAAPAPDPEEEGGAPAEATSLLGRPLERPSLPIDFREQQEALLAEARRDLEAAPNDPDAAIWVARRTAYLGRYREAIEIYSRAIRAHPEHAALYRHRGHRFITVRRLDDAVADLELAARLMRGQPDQVEADGLPNELGIPTSTLQTNIWYHLGLARYLKGDFAGAAEASRTCHELATNPDMRVAAAYWLYLSLRRSGDAAGAAAVLAPITLDLEVIENHDYLVLLLAFAEGGTAPDQLLDDGSDTVGSATRAYGVGAWHLLEGRQSRARAIFDRLLDGTSWAAFGYVAAEAEVSRAGDT